MVEKLLLSYACRLRCSLWESHITNNQNQHASLEPVDGAKDDWRQLGASYSF